MTTIISLVIVMVASESCGNVGDGLPWAVDIVKRVRLRSKGVATQAIDKSKGNNLKEQGVGKDAFDQGIRYCR